MIIKKSQLGIIMHYGLIFCEHFHRSTIKNSRKSIYRQIKIPIPSTAYYWNCCLKNIAFSCTGRYSIIFFFNQRLYLTLTIIQNQMGLSVIHDMMRYEIKNSERIFVYVGPDLPRKRINSKLKIKFSFLEETSNYLLGILILYRYLIQKAGTLKLR